MTKLMILLVIALSTPSNAAISKKVTVTGKVASFDTKKVKLYNRGRITNLPRAFVPKGTQLIIGKEIKVTFDRITR